MRRAKNHPDQIQVRQEDMADIAIYLVQFADYPLLVTINKALVHTAVSRQTAVTDYL